MLQPRTFPVSYEYVGQTAGSKEVEVRARVTGILEKRLFAEGAAVKAGQPLFVIDPKPLEAQAAALSSLFTSPATAWRFGLGLLQPLLALKAIEANVEAAAARRDGVTVESQQTVQNAFREVHDALVTHRSAGDVLAAETARREQLGQALAVATLRYDAGRTSFLEVLDAQRTLLAAETLRIAAARDARMSIVDFAKSLGGGWSP